MMAIIASRPLASSADLSWLCRPYANVNTALSSYGKLSQLTKVEFGGCATKDYKTYPLSSPTHMSRSLDLWALDRIFSVSPSEEL